MLKISFQWLEKFWITNRCLEPVYVNYVFACEVDVGELSVVDFNPEKLYEFVCIWNFERYSFKRTQIRLFQ